MKIKFNLKNTILLISLAIILIIAAIFIVLFNLNKKPVAGFYGIPKHTQEGIVKVLQTTHTRRNKNSEPYEIKVLDSSISLKDALKKAKRVDVLFANKSLNSEYAFNLSAKKTKGFETSLLQEMPTSIKKITPTTKSKLYALPILIDHYEIDVNIQDFKQSNIPAINFWQDIELLSQKTKNSKIASIMIPTKSDEEFLNVIGALVESLSGYETWISLVAKINQFHSENSNLNYTNLIEELTQKDAELYQAITLLKDWTQKGILPKNIDNIDFKDISSYMTGNFTTITFMKLSEHRTIQYQTISKFSSIYYPFLQNNTRRHFTAPVIFAIPLTKNKVVINSTKELATNLQSSLSSSTGLAPVNANCSTPDKQADDVRFWIASCEGPIPTLSDAAFTNSKQRSIFAANLRSLLKN